MTSTRSLTELLTLSPAEGPDTYIGNPETYGNIGVYGGHFLGQALSAAFETVNQDKVANSVHAYFLKAGNPELPIMYQVTKLRDGRGFDNRLVNALQGSNTVFTMLSSFKVEEPGDEHQKQMPSVESADAVRIDREARGDDPFRFPMTLGGRVEMELISDSFATAKFKPGREPVLQSWMKVSETATISPRLAQCMMAYLADGTLMFNSVLPYGIPFQSHRLTSLDQSIWFHRASDVREWMFYDQRSTVTADSRGLNEGEVFDKSGRLLMSTSQESMLRRVS